MYPLETFLVEKLRVKYKIEHCSDKQIWDNFISNSIQGNIFCTTQFLDSWGLNSKTLLVFKNHQIQLAAIIMISDIKFVNPPIRYQGVLFSPNLEATSTHRKIKKNLEITDFLLEELSTLYDRIKFSIHYSVNDLRSFQWFNYHKPEKGQFKLKLRYTGILDLTTTHNNDEILMSARSVRRQEYFKAIKNGFYSEESSDIDILNYLQDLTYKRQEITISDRERKLVTNLSEASLSKGFGRLLICKDKIGNPASAALFIFDQKCGYYLIGATDPKYRKFGLGSYVIFEQIIRCKEQGLKIVDFCGINSPNRGDFKISFNAKPVPYFDVSWNKVI